MNQNLINIPRAVLTSASAAKPIQPASASRAGRAIGAMFFSVFGCAWIGNWALRAYSSNCALLAGIVTVGLTLLFCAITIYRKNKGALSLDVDSAQKKKTDRIFHIVNVGQWVGIWIAVNVLNNVGKPEWAVPAAIFIIGLHFIPLARLFRYFPHYIAGSVLMVWAVVYPWISAGGPTDSIGSLGIGVILWSSAVYGLAHKAN